jgi:hypothetical protein
MEYKEINIKCKEILNTKRLKYTIDFLNSHPLKPQHILLKLNTETQNNLIIDYSNEISKNFCVPVQNLLFGSGPIDFDKININKYDYNGESVFSVESEKSEQGIFLSKKKFSFDIFETVFCHISRFEEVFSENSRKDEHLRMKTQHQLLVRNKLHNIPVVDQLVLAFYRALGFNIQDTGTTFSMTHDIDAIQKFNSALKLPKSILRVLLMGLGISGVFEIIRWYFKALQKKDNDPYYVFDSMLVSDDIFIDKIIFFVAGGKTKFDLFNKNYIKWLPEVIDKAVDKGYAIAYHPSYNAYNEPEIFSEELRVLRKSYLQAILHMRTHFLRLDFNSTFNISANNSIVIDSTLGFPDTIGFRCGTGFRYFLYDFVSEKQSAIIELPMIIMDSALLYIYCKNDIVCFRDKIYQFIEKNKFNTHITFNFHNSTFDRSLKSRSELINIYLELITDISSFNMKINPSCFKIN